MNKIDLLKDLIQRTEKLADEDYHALDALKKDAKMIVKNIFPDEGGGYSAEISNIRFRSHIGSDNRSVWWDEGKEKLLNLFRTLLKQRELFPQPGEDSQKRLSKKELSNEIFIVHGTDEEMKQVVARTLDTLDFEPVILHDKPNQGRTIIEKLEGESELSHFTVVLLSPDDWAYSIEQKSESAKLRARQNVVFELGYFIGKLGRAGVFVLYREADNFEMPSDFKGVVYAPYHKDGDWPMKMAQELKAFGYDVDFNKLF